VRIRQWRLPFISNAGKGSQAASSDWPSSVDGTIVNPRRPANLSIFNATLREGAK
jgi:hypothetical protein